MQRYGPASAHGFSLRQPPDQVCSTWPRAWPVPVQNCHSDGNVMLRYVAKGPPNGSDPGTVATDLTRSDLGCRQCALLIPPAAGAVLEHQEQTDSLVGAADQRHM